MPALYYIALYYILIGLTLTLLILIYDRSTDRTVVDCNDGKILLRFMGGCTFMWPLALILICIEFYSDFLSDVMTVDIRDARLCWKQSLENLTKETRESTVVITVQRKEIKKLNKESIKLKQLHESALRELNYIRESVPGTGQKKSIRKLANIIRTQ